MLQNGIRNIRNMQTLAPITLCLLFVTQAFAQGTAGSITGTVEDAQGAAIPGVRVTAYNQNQKANTAVNTTNGQGVYVFNPLPVSTYTITVDAPGFKTYSQRDI